MQVNGKLWRLLQSSVWSSRIASCLQSEDIDNYILALEPQLCRLRDKEAGPALHAIPFAGPLSAKASAYADDITVFVSHYLEIKAVKKAVARYEQIAGAKINFDKSEGLLLVAWSGGILLPGPFHWSDEPIRILRAGFRPGV